MKEWNSVAVYYDNIDSALTQSVLPLVSDLQKQKLISKFIFNRSWERGENLLVLLKVNDTPDSDKVKFFISEKIKNYLESFPAKEKQIELPVNDWFLPFPNNHVEYNEHFLFDVMETGGVQASLVAEEIFSESTRIVSHLIESSEEPWSSDSAFGPALQLHLGLSLAFFKDVDDLKEFYTFFFDSILELTQINGEDLAEAKQNLLSELIESFESQKEGLGGFINYIIEAIQNKESFEEEWMNRWMNVSADARDQIIKLQEDGKFVSPENFTFDPELNSIESSQELWPVLAYYLRFINCQMNVTGAYELNLIFSLKETLKAL